MRKSQEIIGLSIYHLDTGRKLGHVSDLLFDERSTLLGIVIGTAGFFQKRKYIPVDKVVSLGKDAVIVDSDAKGIPIEKIKSRWTCVLDGHKHFKGRSVLLSTGTELGSIEGVYFMEEVGTLIGYELSNGFIHDLRYGRKILKTKRPLTFGEDVCIALADEVEIQEI